MDVFSKLYNAFIREVATSNLETTIRFSGNAITWRRSKKATGQKKCDSQDSRAPGTPCVLSSNLCKAMNQSHASKNFMEMVRNFSFLLMHLSVVYPESMGLEVCAIRMIGTPSLRAMLERTASGCIWPMTKGQTMTSLS